MPNMSVNAHAKKYRDRQLQSGFRLVQIWVPDTHHSNFVEECRCQCCLVAEADRANIDIQHFKDETLADMNGWAE